MYGNTDCSNSFESGNYAPFQGAATNRESDMKRIIAVLILSAMVAVPLSPATVMAGGTGRPMTYCTVEKAPDEVMMGCWECYYVDGPYRNLVRYTAIKDETGIGVFYEFPRGNIADWKPFIVKGTTIVNQKGNLRFSKEGDIVTFSYNGEQGIKMNRCK